MGRLLSANGTHLPEAVLANSKIFLHNIQMYWSSTVSITASAFALSRPMMNVSIDERQSLSIESHFNIGTGID